MSMFALLAVLVDSAEAREGQACTGRGEDKECEKVTIPDSPSKPSPGEETVKVTYWTGRGDDAVSVTVEVPKDEVKKVKVESDP